MMSCSWFFILISFCYVRSATRCYQCSSQNDPQCNTTLEADFPNKCTNGTNEEVNCLTYLYNTTNGETHTIRRCSALSDTCDDIKNALLQEHKNYLDCDLCKEDLCNKKTSAGLPNGPSTNQLFLLGFCSIVINYFSKYHKLCHIQPILW